MTDNTLGPLATVGLRLLGQGFREHQARVLAKAEQDLAKRLRGISDGGGGVAGTALPAEVIQLEDGLTPSAGDIAYFNGTDWVLLPAGTDGQVLTLAGGVPTWA